MTKLCAACARPAGKAKGGLGPLFTIGSIERIRLHQACFPKWRAFQAAEEARRGTARGTPSVDMRKRPVNPGLSQG
jgi:hypothetical protein